MSDLTKLGKDFVMAEGLPILAAGLGVWALTGKQDKALKVMLTLTNARLESLKLSAQDLVKKEASNAVGAIPSVTRNMQAGTR